MKNELIEKYLSTKSIEDLKQSKVATILIAGRIAVENNVKAQAKVMTDYDANVLRIEKLQKELNKLLESTFIQRVFKIKNFKQKKQSLVDSIAEERKIADGLISDLGSLYAEKGKLMKKIDDFVSLLKQDGLTEKEVIEEYNRLIEMFEKQAETPVADAVETKEQPKVDATAKAPRIEQNSRERRPMSQLERFNARRAKHEAMKSAGAAPYQKGD